MVLIDGIKYACERCIRGHRVTTCNHSDQPLTMIKPKGRPSTQCQHCKDQRKFKNLHINCACKKKGAVGHVPGCVNGACTCYQHHKLKHKQTNKANDKVGSGDTNGMIMDTISPISDYVADSNLLRFKQYSEESLSKENGDSGQEPEYNKDRDHDDDTSFKPDALNWLSNSEGNNYEVNNYNYGFFSQNELEDLEPEQVVDSDRSELGPGNQESHELANDAAFPLFSLIGTLSFETNESIPLSQIPAKNAISRNGSIHGNNLHFSGRPHRPASVLSMNSNTSSVDHSAYPPQITKSNSTTNLKASNPKTPNIKAPVAQIASNHGITETNENELYISDEEIESFLSKGQFGLSPGQFN